EGDGGLRGASAVVQVGPGPLRGVTDQRVRLCLRVDVPRRDAVVRSTADGQAHVPRRGLTHEDVRDRELPLVAGDPWIVPVAIYDRTAAGIVGVKGILGRVLVAAIHADLVE